MLRFWFFVFSKRWLVWDRASIGAAHVQQTLYRRPCAICSCWWWELGFVWAVNLRQSTLSNALAHIRSWTTCARPYSVGAQCGSFRKMCPWLERQGMSSKAPDSKSLCCSNWVESCPAWWNDRTCCLPWAFQLMDASIFIIETSWVRCPLPFSKRVFWNPCLAMGCIWPLWGASWCAQSSMCKFRPVLS